MKKLIILIICAIQLTLCSCGTKVENVEVDLNNQSFEEVAARLNELGIDGFNEEMINNLQEKWNQASDEHRESINKTIWLLDAVGTGTYDYETWTYTPSSDDVYVFDMEFFNVEAMYRDFLQGVSAIGDGDLEFTEIEENLEKVNWEWGIGRRSISFQWRGHTYTLKAYVISDWFDVRIANQLTRIIMKQQEGKRLYFGSDGYQNIYVFYRDAEWAAAFTEVTGMQLVEKVN